MRDQPLGHPGRDLLGLVGSDGVGRGRDESRDVLIEAGQQLVVGVALEVGGALEIVVDGSDVLGNCANLKEEC